MNWPVFSVIIPARNEEKVIAQTIKTILNVNYPKDRLEIFVVIDGSLDKTAEIARQFKKVIIVEEKEPRKCKGDALNAVLPLTKGEIIAIIDADVKISKNAFKAIAKRFRDKNIAAATGPCLSYRTNTFVSRIVSVETSLYNFIQRILSKFNLDAHLHGGNLYVRKSDLIAVGGFDTETMLEDWELSLKIKQKLNKKIIFEPKAVAWQSEPPTISAFWGQRYRWARGTLKVAKKYKKICFQYLLHGFPYYSAPFSLALNFGLFSYILFSSFKILDFVVLPALLIFLFYFCFAFAAKLTNHENLRDIAYIPLWFCFCWIEFFIAAKAFIDEKKKVEFKWFKTPR
ncbi:MAG: glycosyltransferase family 2 protein [Candidatus Nanoarchaeia archaeon]